MTRDSVAALVQKFRRDEILGDISETPLSSSSDDGRDGEATRDSVTTLAQKSRRDEILDDGPETHIFPRSDDARDGEATCDLGAALGQKFRRDEILDDVPGTRASSSSDDALDAQVPRSVKQSVKPGPSAERPATATEFVGNKQAAVVSHTSRSPARLLIRIQHDGRKATVQDESVVLIRYDDGCTAEVSLASIVVLGTAAA